MSNDEELVLICAAARPGEAVIPGSVRDFCLGCDRPIWVAPTGQQLRSNGALLYCLACGMRKMEADKSTISPPFPEQIAEVRAHLGGGATRPSEG